MIKSLLGQPLFKLIFGSGLGQLISLIALPFITRLYMPEFFGELAIISSLLAFVLNVMFWQSERLIVLVNDEEIGCVLRYILKIGFCFSLLAAILIPIFGAIGFGSVEKVSTSMLYLIFPGLIFLGMMRISRLLATRDKDFGSMAKAPVLNALVASLSKLSYGVFSANAFFLMFSDMTANITTQWVYLKSWRNKHIFSFQPHIQFKVIAARYRDFFTFGQLSTMLDSVAVLLPIQFVGSIFGLKEAGFYALAYRIASLPLVHIGSAKGDLYNSKFSELYRLGKLTEFCNYFYSQLRKDLWVTVAIYSLVALVSPFVFPLIFGAQWGDSGHVVSIFSVWLASAFFVVPYSHILIILNEQRLKMIYEGSNILILCCVYLFFKNVDELSFFIILSAAQFLTYCIYFFLILKAVRARKN